MRPGGLGGGPLMLDEAGRFDRDAGGLRGAGREDGGLAERAGGLVVNRDGERLARGAERGLVCGRERRGDRCDRLREGRRRRRIPGVQPIRTDVAGIDQAGAGQPRACGHSQNGGDGDEEPADQSLE